MKIIFDFIFEDSLKICDGKIGTAKYSLPYRLMSQNVKDKKHLVEQLLSNWNQLLPFFRRLKYVFEE